MKPDRKILSLGLMPDAVLPARAEGVTAERSAKSPAFSPHRRAYVWPDESPARARAQD